MSLPWRVLAGVLIGACLALWIHPSLRHRLLTGMRADGSHQAILTPPKLDEPVTYESTFQWQHVGALRILRGAENSESDLLTLTEIAQEASGREPRNAFWPSMSAIWLSKLEEDSAAESWAAAAARPSWNSGAKHFYRKKATALAQKDGFLASWHLAAAARHAPQSAEWLALARLGNEATGRQEALIATAIREAALTQEVSLGADDAARSGVRRMDFSSPESSPNGEVIRRALAPPPERPEPPARGLVAFSAAGPGACMLTGLASVAIFGLLWLGSRKEAESLLFSQAAVVVASAIAAVASLTLGTWPAALAAIVCGGLYIVAFRMGEAEVKRLTSGQAALSTILGGISALAFAGYLILRSNAWGALGVSQAAPTAVLGVSIIGAFLGLAMSAAFARSSRGSTCRVAILSGISAAKGAAAICLTLGVVAAAWSLLAEASLISRLESAYAPL